MKRKKAKKIESRPYYAPLMEKIRENLRSLLIGLACVVVLVLLAAKFIPSISHKITSTKGKSAVENKQNIATDGASIKRNQAQQETNKTYEVKQGDNLWTIAEQYYGSGYNAYDIAKANNISQASSIDVGQKLIIPSITPKQPTKGEITAEAAHTEKGGVITSNGNLGAAIQNLQPKTYTVQHGDYLWKIAVDMYGDGYQWVRIARANNLKMPGIIHAGNILIIPRD